MVNSLGHSSHYDDNWDVTWPSHWQKSTTQIGENTNVVLLPDNIKENLSNPNRIWFAQALFQLEEVGPNKKPFDMVCSPRHTSWIYATLTTHKPIFVAEAYNECYGEVIDFIVHGRVPSNRNKARKVHQMAAQYLLNDDILYHRGLDTILFQCLT